MSSSSHSVSASDGSRCVAGARLSWSSCFVFRTCEMHVVRDAESKGTLSTMGMSWPRRTRVQGSLRPETNRARSRSLLLPLVWTLMWCQVNARPSAAWDGFPTMAYLIWSSGVVSWRCTHSWDVQRLSFRTCNRKRDEIASLQR